MSRGVPGWVSVIILWTQSGLALWELSQSGLALHEETQSGLALHAVRIGTLSNWTVGDIILDQKVRIGSLESSKRWTRKSGLALRSPPNGWTRKSGLALWNSSDGWTTQSGLAVGDMCRWSHFLNTGWEATECNTKETLHQNRWCQHKSLSVQCIVNSKSATFHTLYGSTWDNWVVKNIRKLRSDVSCLKIRCWFLDLQGLDYGNCLVLNTPGRSQCEPSELSILCFRDSK